MFTMWFEKENRFDRSLKKTLKIPKRLSEGQKIQWPKEKETTRLTKFNKTRHRKLSMEQHETH